MCLVLLKCLLNALFYTYFLFLSVKLKTHFFPNNASFPFFLCLKLARFTQFLLLPSLFFIHFYPCGSL
jgi:hypothetical protein